MHVYASMGWVQAGRGAELGFWRCVNEEAMNTGTSERKCPPTEVVALPGLDQRTHNCRRVFLKHPARGALDIAFALLRKGLLPFEKTLEGQIHGGCR